MYLFGLAECSGYNSGVLRESYRSVGSDIPPPPHTPMQPAIFPNLIPKREMSRMQLLPEGAGERLERFVPAFGFQLKKPVSLSVQVTLSGLRK